MTTRSSLTVLIISCLFLLTVHKGGISASEPASIVEGGVLYGPKEDTSTRQLQLVTEAYAVALAREVRIPLDEARDIVRIIEDELPAYTQPLDLSFILGLIVVESAGNAQARSIVGARGLMQIMPGTGRFIASKLGEEWGGTKTLYQRELNIRYGIWYIHYLYENFERNKHAAIGAYNWGPDHVGSRLARGKPLPKVYPGKVYAAEESIRKEVYVIYKEYLWWSRDLNQGLPNIPIHPNQPDSSAHHPSLLVNV